MRRVGRTGTTRRHALMAAGAGVAGLLAACSSTGSPDGGAAAASAARAARLESALRRRAASAGRELLVLYDAVRERHPAQDARLAPLRAAVARQVTALVPGSRTPSGTTEPSGEPDTRSGRPEKPSASPVAAAPDPVPADPSEALRALAAAERRTGDAHTAALMEAPPELARLLASLAAASAAHAYLLTEGSRS
ncbi:MULTISPECIES: hypothetical protein [unclassified Streptomyces]|uniref:hypothetical protein n=1 Tax=unclassified Streptomyces TaxID=2593676 RepID=UPI0037F5C06D